MRQRLRSIVLSTAMAGLIFGSMTTAIAKGEKSLVGSYRLTKRVAADGKDVTDPELLGFMTFAKEYRTVIMKWSGRDGKPASIAFMSSYALSNGKFCESVIYGANVDLGAPGVTYDTPSSMPECTTATSDASGLAFDIPSEHQHFLVSRDGLVATTLRWTDHWTKVK